MGQAEIQKILERKNKKYVSTVEIAKTLRQSTSVVTRALNTMLHYKEVLKTKRGITFYWRIKKSPVAQLVIRK